MTPDYGSLGESNRVVSTYDPSTASGMTSACRDAVAEGQPEIPSSDFQKKTWTIVANAARVSKRIRPVIGIDRATPTFSTIPLIAVIKHTETAACQPRKAPAMAVIAGTLNSEHLLAAESTSPGDSERPRINPTRNPHVLSANPATGPGPLRLRSERDECRKRPQKRGAPEGLRTRQFDAGS